MMRPVDWKRIRHFTSDEWKQKPDKVSRHLVFTLDEVREFANCKIFIIEAYAELGHADYSYHHIGLAVDFFFEKLDPLRQFILLSSFPQIGAIGYYPYDGGSWHVDLRFSEVRKLWFRDSQGNYHYGYSSLALQLQEDLC